MGYNTTVVIYNDALHEIRNDPEFGKKLVGVILEQDGLRPKSFFASGKQGDYTFSSTAGVVVEQHHADDTAIVAVGGNTGIMIHIQSGGSDFMSQDGQAALLEKALRTKKA
jgi:hypothetical protein